MRGVPATLEGRIAALACWKGRIGIEPLAGGLTNRNVLVRAANGCFVVRAGDDVPAHDIDRRAELAATRAAAAAGLGPEVVHAEAGILVLRYIDGRTLEASELGEPAHLGRIIALLRRCRDDMPALYRGPPRDRSPVAVLRRYAEALAARPNRWREAARRHAGHIETAARLLDRRPPGFAHNDMHAGNLVDDGRRLWLLDWEYAGMGDSLMDLASLSVNGGLSPALDERMLALWGEDQARHGLGAMRLAAALRDLYWAYAQDALVAPIEQPDYIAIDEARVRQAAQALEES